MKKRFLIILSAMLLLLTSCSPKSPSAPESGSENSDPSAIENSENEEVLGILADFSAATLAGENIDESVLAEYQLTMVNVWATFCSPCISEMPELGELSGEYEEQGVQILGIVSDVLNSDGSISQTQVDTAKDIVESTQANYTHILPSTDLFGLLSQITSVPTTFFVDKDGKQVGYSYLGSKSKEEWKIIIDQTLQEVAE